MPLFKVLGEIVNAPDPAKLPERLISFAVKEVSPSPEAVLPTVIVEVPALSVKALLAPVIAPPSVNAVLAVAVEMLVLSANEIPVLPSPILTIPPLVIVPANVTPLGAVAVRLPEKVKPSELELPRANVPVFANVILLVTELVVPSNFTL